MITIPTNQISRMGKHLIRTLGGPKPLMVRCGQVRGSPMGCYQGNQTDQSDFEVGKTPDSDLRRTKTIDSQVWTGERSTNEV